MGIDASALRGLKADLGRVSFKATGLASAAVAKTALGIEASAKALTPVDTGNLRNSISSDVKTLSAEIGPTADYGVYLELGTSRMGPQPYMNPAADKWFPIFDAAMAKIAEP